MVGIIFGMLFSIKAFREGEPLWGVVFLLMTIAISWISYGGALG